MRVCALPAWVVQLERPNASDVTGWCTMLEAFLSFYLSFINKCFMLGNVFCIEIILISVTLSIVEYIVYT